MKSKRIFNCCCECIIITIQEKSYVSRGFDFELLWCKSLQLILCIQTCFDQTELGSLVWLICKDLMIMQTREKIIKSYRTSWGKLLSSGQKIKLRWTTYVKYINFKFQTNLFNLRFKPTFSTCFSNDSLLFFKEYSSILITKLYLSISLMNNWFYIAR